DKERLDRTEKLSSRCRVRMPTGRFRYALPGGRIAETVPLLRNFVPKRLRDNLPWKGQRAELSPIRATQAFFAACLPRNRSIPIYVAAASNPATTARKVKSQPLASRRGRVQKKARQAPGRPVYHGGRTRCKHPAPAGKKACLVNSSAPQPKQLTRRLGDARRTERSRENFAPLTPSPATE